jgi:hypothetical protein
MRILHDCKDAGGRAMHGAIAEEQISVLAVVSRPTKPIPANIRNLFIIR